MTADASSEVRFAVRPMRAEDEAFLYANFLKFYRYSDHTEGLPNGVYYATFKEQWAHVLKHFNVLVAHPEGEESETAGFIAWKGKTLAWVYTKAKPWGGLGVAKLLMREAGFVRQDDVVWALYASSRDLAVARAKGWRVEMVPATQAIRLLLGVA